VEVKLLEFIHAIPKVELHVHLEGTLSPELMFALAKRNKIAVPFENLAQTREFYNFQSVNQFFAVYQQAIEVLQTEQDFFDLTYSYLTEAAKQNIKHCEVFFDALMHTERGIKIATVINGIDQAFKKAKKELGITALAILCIPRHFSVEKAFASLNDAISFKEKIVAIGLDWGEEGNPPEKFKDVFTRAKKEGFRITAHACDGPREYIYQLLDIVKVDRIDHGVKASEDQSLVAKLAKEKIPLTVCPISNLAIGMYSSVEKHPIKLLLEKGVLATINSDDPAILKYNLEGNYQAFAKAFSANHEQIYQLVKNSIIASFASQERKDELFLLLADFASKNMEGKTDVSH
jgi:adenine deaminase